MKTNEIHSFTHTLHCVIDYGELSGSSRKKEPPVFSRGLLGRMTMMMFLLISGMSLRAQVNMYSFTETSGAYSEITGGTIVATANANTGSAPGSMDSYNSGALTLPFAFNFAGVNQSTVYMNGNGYLTFGAAASTFTSTPISTTNVYNGAVSAWGGDLNCVFNIGGRTGEFRWETVGSAPNREIVFQWKNIRPSYSSSTANAFTFSFQIRLIETTNEIKVVYGPGSFAIGSTAFTGTSNRQIGLRGSTNTAFNNRVWTSFSSASTAGTLNSSANSWNTSTNFPASGKTLTWSPPQPCAGTPTPGNTLASATSGFCAGNNVALSLQNATLGTGVTYQWKSSSDGVTYNNIVGATNSTLSVGVMNNGYYACDVTCSGSTGTQLPFTSLLTPP